MKLYILWLKGEPIFFLKHPHPGFSEEPLNGRTLRSLCKPYKDRAKFLGYFPNEESLRERMEEDNIEAEVFFYDPGWYLVNLSIRGNPISIEEWDQVLTPLYNADDVVDRVIQRFKDDILGWVIYLEAHEWVKGWDAKEALWYLKAFLDGRKNVTAEEVMEEVLKMLKIGSDCPAFLNPGAFTEIKEAFIEGLKEGGG